MPTISTKRAVIRNIYLYLVTLVGLFMIVIPSVDIIKIGLETWIFPLASEDNYNYKPRIPEPYFAKDQIVATDEAETETLQLTKEEKQMFERWKEEFKAWEETEKNKDYATINKQKNLVRDISVLAGGLALFLSHGYVLRKRKT